MLTDTDIYEVEHEVMEKALDDWLAMDRNTAAEDLQWVMGVVNMTSALVEKINAEANGDGDGNC